MHKERLNRREFLKRSALLGGAMVAMPSLLTAKPSVKLPSQIVFLGDSITMASTYINLFEYYLRVHYPKWEGEIINMGLSSETVSGLSEPSHPFPRPFVHNRLRTVLERTKPELTFVCYGMNCGIYHPMSEERFRAYQAGMRGVVNLLSQNNSEIVLLTPPPFAHNQQEKTELAQGEAYSYSKPYERYDSVLKNFGNWLKVTYTGEYPVVDIHEAITPFKQICYGKDIVHPNFNGHFIMAHGILKELKLLKEEKTKVSLKEKAVEQYDFKQSFPLIYPASFFEDNKYPDVLKKIMLDMNAQLLVLKGLARNEGFLLSKDKDKLVQASGKEWRKGKVIHVVTNEEEQMPVNQLWELIKKKREVYDRALLNAIGHGNPNVKAKSLTEAEKVRLEIMEKLEIVDRRRVLELSLKRV